MRCTQVRNEEHPGNLTIEFSLEGDKWVEVIVGMSVLLKTCQFSGPLCLGILGFLSNEIRCLGFPPSQPNHLVDNPDHVIWPHPFHPPRPSSNPPCPVVVRNLPSAVHLLRPDHRCHE